MNTSSRPIIQPKNIDFDSPGRRDYLVALEHDTIWGDWLIPLTVWVGPEAETGKGLVAFGSNHGNEYEGPVTLKNLLGEIQTEDVRGRIILVPVLNPAAFKAGMRDSIGADGVNLNRAFVEGAGTTPALNGITHRIARFVREFIWPHVHIVIDLHSGGRFLQFGLCSSFHLVEDKEQERQMEEAAKWFGTPLIMNYQNATPGLLPSEAENLGKITIGTELGWGEGVNQDGARFARQGVLAAAINHHQLRGEIKPIAHHADGTQHRAEIVARECYHTIPFGGHYEPRVANAQMVKKGDLLGLLHDFGKIDSAPFEMRSNLDGIVVAQTSGAVVPQGQHVVCVGRVVW